MLRRIAAGLLVAAASLAAQETNYGIDVPVTLSGGLLDSQRLQLANPAESQVSGGFRAMLYPAVKLGPHWFGYAAVQIRMTPYFYYDAFSPRHQWNTDAIQAYMGYSLHGRNTSMVIKAGQLASAFGSFPLRYDDLENPLLDQPLSYITELPLRGDQLVCNTADLLRQHYGSVAGACGGNPGRAGGLTPVTLYGLPGMELDGSRGHFDGRVQLTGRSPANSESWTTGTHYLQWAAGGGYTIRHGFRIGVSGFRGPYLSSAVDSRLPAGTSVRDYLASGLGVDGQWARGRWKLNGEWQRFQFDVPGFSRSPSAASGYAEVKTVLTPRIFVAARLGRLTTGGVTDIGGTSAPRFAPAMTSLETGSGFWIGRGLLFKFSYGKLHSTGQTNHRTDILGFQLVASFHQLNRAFR